MALQRARQRIEDTTILTRAAARTAPLLLIVVIAVVGLGFMIPRPDGLFNRYSDLLAYHLGAQTVLHQAWHNEHRLPLWRPDILSGEPALTNPQSLYTHPLHGLFALYRPERVVGLVIWLQMLLAALGGYYAAIALRLSISARLVVAIAVLFSFKTILAVYAGWLAIVAGIAAMPLLFGTAAIAMDRPSVRSALALGGAGTLSLHTGQLQLAYYSALFIAVWSSVRIGRQLANGNPRTAGSVAGSLVLGLMVACGLSAYLMLPLARDARLVTRGAASYDFFLGNNPGLTLLTLFNPELFGTPLDGTFVEAWEYVAYFGAATSLLGLAGALRGRRRPHVPVLMLGFLLSILLSLHTPLLRIVYALVPGYGLFRLPTRILFVSAFFACCLAGVGLDEVLSAIRNGRARTAVAAAAIGLVTLEGSVWAWRYLRTHDPIPAVTTGAYLTALESDGELARVAPLARSIPIYGWAAPLGLQLITGYDSFTMRYYQTYMDLLQYNEARGVRPAVWTDVNDIRRLDLLAALNVLYIVAPRKVDLPTTEYALVGSFDNQPQFRFYQGLVSGPVYVYRNQRFLRRAFFASHVLSAFDDDTMVRQVQDADLRETAIVAAPGIAGASAPIAGDHVDIVRSAAGELNLATRNAGRRFLVISEVWHPGWGARIDGRVAPLHRTDVALLGLWVEPGDHLIELRFWPPGLTAGLLVTGLTGLGVVGLLVFLARR